MKYYRKKTVEQDYTNNNYTKCWTCKNACGGCSWSRDFQPVPGWNAVPTFHPSNVGNENSFHVISCPEYVRG